MKLGTIQSRSVSLQRRYQQHQHNQPALWKGVLCTNPLSSEILDPQAVIFSKDQQREDCTEAEEKEQSKRVAYVTNSSDSIEDNEVQLNSYTLVKLLGACTKPSDVWEAKRLQAMAERKGPISNVFLGTALVSTYGRCRDIGYAEEVFNKLSVRNVVTWCALLSVYVEQGQGEKALQLYRQMIEESVELDQQTLVVVLRAFCLFALEGTQSKVTCFEIGQALHAHAGKRGFMSNSFIGTTLVSMYGKLGILLHAMHVFLGLPQDVVSWNALISAYIEQNQCEKALQLFTEMQGEGVQFNEKTLTAVIQACYTADENVTMAFLHIGMGLHIDSLCNMLGTDAFLANALITLYGRYGCFLEAENVFSGISFCDVGSWVAMLSAYVEQGLGEKALLLYRQMQDMGISLDGRTLRITVQACAALADSSNLMAGKDADDVGEYVQPTKQMALDILQALHSEAWKNGLSSDASLCGAFLFAYGRCGSFHYAEHAFAQLSQHDVVCWSELLSAYVEQGRAGIALLTYRQMQEEGVSPDELTFIFSLQACCAFVATDEEQPTEAFPTLIVKALHADAQRQGFTEDIAVASTLVTAYGKLGSIANAEDAFSSFSMCATVLCNAMLSVYVEQEEGEKTMLLYFQMQEEHIPMNHITFLCALQACSVIGSLEICRQLHLSIVSAGVDRYISVINTLIRAYGSCDSVLDSQSIFDGLCMPSLTSWNAYIAGYSQKGDISTSERMLNEIQAGVVLDDVTLLLYLSACSHVGLVRNAFDCYEFMAQACGLYRNMKHFMAMLDLLGRVGKFEHVESLCLGFPRKLTLPAWLCLLGMCTAHGNLELAKHAFDHAVNLRCSEPAVYVMMSNIYGFSSVYL